MTERYITNQKGQAMAEFSISLPFLAPIILVMIMLIIQWATIYRDKMTLNAASFEAARAGSLNSGSESKMYEALAQGMLPVFMRDESTNQEVGRAYVRSKAYTTLGAQINVLNPTQAIFDKHKIERKDRSGNRWYEIPNDNLMYRDSTAEKISDDLFVNVQDANLLKIEVNWCKKLEVPIANWVIGQILTLTDVSLDRNDPKFVVFNQGEHQAQCNLLGVIAGTDTYSDYYISIKSYALIRMQTPFKI